MSIACSKDASVNSTTRFRCGLELAHYKLGNGTELVYSPQSGVSRVLTAQDTQLLQHLRDFATLDQHAASTCKRLGLAPHRVAQIRDQLAALADGQKELLISHDSLLERLIQAPSRSHLPAEPIKSLAVPTRNRPEIFKQCLRSFAESAKTHGHDIRLVVMDGSDDPAMAQANIATLRSIKKEFGNEVLYLDRRSVQDFAVRIAKASGLPPEVIEFALINVEQCPVDTGANRNALLLATVGELTVQVDDDTVCSVAPCPGMRDGLTLTSLPVPTDMWFPTADEGLPEVRSDVDFINLHAQVLGQSVCNQIGSQSADQIDLDQLGLTFLDRMRADGGCVLVSSIGMAGDSGTGNPFYSFLRLDNQSRSRLIGSESGYRYAMDNHRVVRCVTSATIGDRAFVSGVNMGLDNRRMLPPFTPVQREQDTIFSSFIYRSGAGYFAHLPWALVHSRSQPFEHDLCISAGQVLSGRIMSLLLQKFTLIKHKTAEENLMALGRYLEELGSLPLDSFEETVRQSVWSAAEQRIDVLEQLLHKHARRPQFWASDIERYIDATRIALPAPHYHVAADLIQAFGMEQARTLMQRLVLRVGKLLQVWPHVRAAAQELRVQGAACGTEI